MDSLLFNTPRPFSKYPSGYRPMSAAVNRGANLRHFSSMSNMSPDSFQQYPGQEEHQSRPFSMRAGSVDPYTDHGPGDSVLSSRCASPSPWTGFSPPVPDNRSIPPPLSPTKVSGDDFLNRLRQQKAEIERSLSKPNDYANEFLSNNRNTLSSSMYAPREASYQAPLHKTLSDSNVLSTTTPSYTLRDPRENSGMAAKNGFFRQSYVEPNWMTNPPPPFGMDDMHNDRWRDRESDHQQPLNQGPADHDRPHRVIPIQLDDDRVLKIYSPPPEARGQIEKLRPHRSDAPAFDISYPRDVVPEVPTSYPYRDNRTNYLHDSYREPSYSRLNDDNRLHAAAHLNIQHRQQSNEFSPYEYDPMHGQPMSNIISRNYSTTEEPRRRVQPTLSPDPWQSSVEDEYIRRNQVREPSRYPSAASQLANLYSRNYSNKPSSSRDLEEMVEPPINGRPMGFFAQGQGSRNGYSEPRQLSNSRSERERDQFSPEALFSPVSSKVYTGGPTRINGFINDNTRFTREATPGRTGERLFAVVSRPQTPPVTLEPSSVPVAVVRPGDGSLRTFSPPLSVAVSPQNGTLSPSMLDRQLSPMSVYDNDTDSERKPLHRELRPQSILVKRHDYPRPAKKVVFRDDELEFSQLINSPASAEAPPHVRSYDDVIEDPLARFGKLSDKIGGDVAEMKKKVQATFDQLRQFLWIAAGRIKPSDDELRKLMQPIGDLTQEINSIKDSKRRSPHFNHLSAIADGIPAVFWIAVEKTPAPHVGEMLNAAMFYLNRILKDHKDGDQTHVEWVKTWREILETMQKFVRQTHTTGLVWNSAPGAVPSGSGSAPVAVPRAGGPAPPPPPPPPPADLMAGLAVSQSAADREKAGRDALFASLNKGEAITSGLRKVTSDMQTHKNPALRGQGTTPGSVGGTGAAPKAAAAPVVRPPKIELQDGKQWNVEYHVNNRNIVVTAQDKKQTIYVYKCEGSVIQVKGKVNSITLDNCKKTSIVFDALVAQCETINCQSVQIQTLGEMPTLSIQKTDGCHVYLSEAAKNCEIVTSKSSEMNILVPDGPDGDYVEFPVPEQFKTVYSGGKLVTCASDII